jgi:starch synthase
MRAHALRHEAPVRMVKGAAMDILFVATELWPYVKVGGLADVTASLTKALRGLGHKVTLVLPRFPVFEEGGLLVARRLTPMKLPMNKEAGGTVDVTVYDGRLASQVDLVLIDVAEQGKSLFHRTGVYGERGEDYPDNARRFAIFSRAAAELAKQRAETRAPYDIVHCHDWPTALVPAFLRELAKETPALAATRSVLTIHNLAYQGVFPKAMLPELGLGWDAYGIDGIEFYGGLNVLKHGILNADAVTTVSETYARDIQTEARGERLDGVLRARGSALIGITNGVDYGVWNPSTDSALATRYDAQGIGGKTRCRGALQRELGLPVDLEAPIVANVGRIVEQKGTDALVPAIAKLLRSTDAQFIVAGDGDPGIMAKLAEAAQKSQGRMVFAPAAAEPLVHRIFAGADLVVVPSRFEPCGLVQLYAQRYGAIPVAHATGGLIDTVIDCDAKLETGTGFLFEAVTTPDIVAAIERAIAARVAHTNGGAWPALVRRVMRLDRGWERPARRYEQVYRSLTK